MATDAVKFRTYTKKLLPFDQLDTAFLAYLSTITEDTSSAMFDLPVAIKAAIPVTAPGNRNISVGAAGGPFKAATGLGRLIKFSAADSRLQTVPVPFDSLPYNVALESVLVEDQIEVNPRTGDNEYRQLKEDIGRITTPSAVAWNGANQLTLTLQAANAFEAGKDNTGRQITVWLVPKQQGGPGPKSASPAVAFFTGSLNASNQLVIASATPLGQATASVSTLASDYRCLIKGPTVRRVAVEDLTATSGAIFLATFTTPATSGAAVTAISTAAQKLVSFSLSDLSTVFLRDAHGFVKVQVTADASDAAQGQVIVKNNAGTTTFQVDEAGRITDENIGATGLKLSAPADNTLQTTKQTILGAIEDLRQGMVVEPAYFITSAGPGFSSAGLTITGNTNAYAWVGGKRINISGLSVALTDAAINYVYLQSNGTLAATTTPATSALNDYGATLIQIVTTAAGAVSGYTNSYRGGGNELWTITVGGAATNITNSHFKVFSDAINFAAAMQANSKCTFEIVLLSTVNIGATQVIPAACRGLKIRGVRSEMNATGDASNPPGFSFNVAAGGLNIDVQADDVTFESISAYFSLAFAGANAGGNNGFSSTTGINRLTFRNCRFNGGASLGSAKYVISDASGSISDLLVDACYFEINTVNRPLTSGGGTCQIYGNNAASTRWRIINSRFSGPGTAYATSIDSGIVLTATTAGRHLIQNNHFMGAGYSGAILSCDAPQSRIAFNHITNGSLAPSVVISCGAKSVVVGNQIISVNNLAAVNANAGTRFGTAYITSGYGGLAGGNASSATNDVVVADNVIDCTGATMSAALASYGVKCNGGTGWTIVNNRILGIAGWLNGQDVSAAIDISGSTSSAATTTVCGNVISGCGHYGIRANNTVGSALVISGNIITQWGQAGASGFAYDAIWIGNGSGVTICGNTLTCTFTAGSATNTNAYGINIGNMAAIATAIVSGNYIKISASTVNIGFINGIKCDITRSSITGNVIEGLLNSALTTSVCLGVYIYGGRWCTVSNNVFYNIQGSAINFGNASNGIACTVSGNVVDKTGVSVASPTSVNSAGIVVTNALAYCVINGNVCTNPPAGLAGILLDTGTTNCIATSNLANVVNSGTSTAVANNVAPPNPLT